MRNEFDVTSPVEVVHLLRELIRTRELLNVSFNHGKDSMPTLLLHADPDRDSLVFDGSSDKTINRSIVAASRVAFSGSLRGAKIEFSSVGAKEIAFHGAPALAVKFPSSVRRFQNRESFRVRTSSATCTLPVPGRGYVSVPVNEVSVGGTLVMLDYASDAFHIGQTIECQLKLGAAGTVRCKLEVRGFKRVGRMLGMGCRFVGLSRNDEAMIARYVAQQERETITKSNVFGR